MKTFPRGSRQRPRHLTGRRQTIPARVVESILKRLTYEFSNRLYPDCWISTGSVNAAGYTRRSWADLGGHFHLFCHQIIARAVWRAGGPLNENEVVHHVCGHKRCVNPLHLEILTRKEHAEKHRRAWWSSKAA